MKIFFYMNRNAKNKCGLSMKIWKIERKGKTITAQWGAAVVNKDSKAPVPAYRLQRKVWKFKTEARAISCEEIKINEKLRSGYERKPRINCTK